MNQEIGDPIAYGRTAEIYAWGDGQVLKLFYDWVGLEAVQFEQRIGRAVYENELPSPAVGEIVHCKQRHGLVYQRVAGVSMFEVLARRPWRAFNYARWMAVLHAAMHASTTTAELSHQHQRLRDKIETATALPPQLRSRALASLEALPPGDRLCHGDFHPGNIMVAGHQATIIDWIDTTLGNPLADVARTNVILQSALEAGYFPNPLLKAITRAFLNIYRRHYFSLRPGGKTEYTRWLPVIAAARLSENIAGMEGWLLAQAEKAGSLR